MTAATPQYETPLADLPAALPEGAPLFGLDISKTAIGIALSDPAWRMATPLTTIRRTKFGADARALLALMAEHRAGGLIIGLPLNMDGSEGPRAQSVRAFARNLSPLTEAPLAFFDERLSTFEAEDQLVAAGLKRDKRAALIDQTAAAIILQGALDAMAGLKREIL